MIEENKNYIDCKIVKQQAMADLMEVKTGDKVFLAGPFFNEEQSTTMHILEGMCTEYKWKYFSAGVDSPLPTNRKATLEEQIKAFNDDMREIHNSKFMLARIDDFDNGTMLEMGYAYGLRKPIIAFTTFEEGRGMNLMLAQSVVGFIQGLKNVQKFLCGMPHPHDSTLRVLDVSVLKYWSKEVF